MLPLAFRALSLYQRQERHLRECFLEIRHNRNFTLLKEIMLKWFQYHNLKRIEANMMRFYNFKQVKKAVEAWKRVRLVNSEKRRNRMVIRRALKRKPELAKPLFVVRNVLLYKAFKLFKMGVKE